MKTPNTYEIESISDISEMITLENFDRFMADFIVCLHTYAKIKDKHPETKYPSMTWIDDGKHEITIKLNETACEHEWIDTHSGYCRDCTKCGKKE